MTTGLNLNLNIKYHLNGEDPVRLEECVADALRNAIKNGILNRNSPAEVASYALKIEAPEANMDSEDRGEIRHDFNDGKYTLINNDGKLTALRHGEPWGRDLTGDNLVYWMLVEVDNLKRQRDELAAKLSDTVKPEDMPTVENICRIMNLDVRRWAGKDGKEVWEWVETHVNGESSGETFKTKEEAEMNAVNTLFPRKDWIYEAENNITSLGYLEWAMNEAHCQTDDEVHLPREGH